MFIKGIGIMFKASGKIRQFVVASFIAVGIAGMGVSAPVEAADMKSWQKKLVSLIKEKQTYPRAALSPGNPGPP